MQIGTTIRFVDAEMKQHYALVTSTFETGNPGHRPSINLVYVSADEKAEDQYGRQLERETSVVHVKQQSANGMYWYYD